MSDLVHNRTVNAAGHSRGFMALIAVILLGTTALVFSIVTLAQAADYADAVSRRELRIQAGMNADACLAQLSLMFAKDYFLGGAVEIAEFGCDAEVANNGAGAITVSAKATLEGVSVEKSGSFSL